MKNVTNVIPNTKPGITDKDRESLITTIHEQNKSKYDKVDRIAEYQKYVNTELDSCYCTLTDYYTPVVDENVPFQKISGSMSVSDGLITIKPGQRVLVNISLGYHDNLNQYANVNYFLTDVTNGVQIAFIGPYRADINYELGCSAQAQYTNETEHDCQIGLRVSGVYGAGSLGPWYSTLTVAEIGRAITIDPVEYVNTSQGIEDAPVGHIISHMGTVAPKHYLICDGAEYPIADYPYLVQHIKDNFGSVNYFGGDGESTFAVPDLRGEFLRGSGTATRNTGSGGEVGEHQDGTTLPAMKNSGTNGMDYFLGSTSQQDSVVATSQIAHYIQKTSQWNTAAPYDASTITSRPTNTSVLYCIKYEPTYYMQVHQTNYMQQNIYSEEEQVVGKWIDGKPIYRRTIVTTLPIVATHGTYVHSPIQLGCSVDHVLSLTGTLTNNAGSCYTIPYTSNDTSGQTKAYVEKSRNVIYLGTNQMGFSGCPIAVIVEYTKTTDAENSFTNDMIQDEYVSTEPYTDQEVIDAVGSLWQ